MPSFRSKTQRCLFRAMLSCCALVQKQNNANKPRKNPTSQRDPLIRCSIDLFERIDGHYCLNWGLTVLEHGDLAGTTGRVRSPRRLATVLYLLQASLKSQSRAFPESELHVLLDLSNSQFDSKNLVACSQVVCLCLYCRSYIFVLAVFGPLMNSDNILCIFTL